MAAGLLAKKAVERGLQPQPWVKASLAPGLESGVGLSGPCRPDALPSTSSASIWWDMVAPPVSVTPVHCLNLSKKRSKKGDLTVGAVLSGNRNFEGRIHPLVKTNWLASPPLVVAYALAGNMNIDLTREPLGQGKNGEPVYLKDIWPSGEEIARAVEQVSTEMFRKRVRGSVFRH